MIILYTKLQNKAVSTGSNYFTDLYRRAVIQGGFYWRLEPLIDLHGTEGPLVVRATNSWIGRRMVAEQGGNYTGINNSLTQMK